MCFIENDRSPSGVVMNLPPALCDFWYARELPDLAEPLDAGVVHAKRRNIGERIRAMRDLRRRAKGRIAIPNWYQYGPFYLLWAALHGDRNVMLVEVIDIRLEGRPALLRYAWELFARTVLAAAIRRTVCAVQVMSVRESRDFARRYRLDPARIHVVRWPLTGWSRAIAAEAPPPPAAIPYVFSSGRTGCDWVTLFAAAEGTQWPLTVVCAGGDRARVDALNHDARATVYSDIPQPEHDRLLRGASLYALVLSEQGKSAGQVRLGTCISLDVPVVGTSVSGLDGFLENDVTGRAVPPGDAPGLRAAIDALMADPHLRNDLVRRARAHTDGYGKAAYFAAIGDLIKRYAQAYDA